MQQPVNAPPGIPHPAVLASNSSDAARVLGYRGRVTTKRGSGTDQREDPSSDEAPTDYRVDRVFAAPAAPPRPRRETASEAANALLASKRTPVPSQELEGEASLRRQLSRLQRQLAEAQLELSRKEEELAEQAEMRASSLVEHSRLVEEHRSLTMRLDDLAAYQTRLAAAEQRLLELVTVGEELTHELDRERDQRTAEQARVADLQASLEDAQLRWKTERAALEQQHGEELARIETLKQTTAEQAEEALTAATARLREGYEEQLTGLRESHERSLAALRGDLEPQLLAARSLAVEHERITNELAELRSTTTRDAAERDEAHKREVTQLGEANASHAATQTRLYSLELTRAQEERDAKALALDQATTAAGEREKTFTETSETLHEAKKKLQVELAEAKERTTRLEGEKAALDERIATAMTATGQLETERQTLQEKLAASEDDARRHEQDRCRFVAYLEEGLALIGAIPAQIVTIEADEPGPDDPAPPVD